METGFQAAQAHPGDFHPPGYHREHSLRGDDGIRVIKIVARGEATRLTVKRQSGLIVALIPRVCS
jgi:hypothetical protein